MRTTILFQQRKRLLSDTLPLIFPPHIKGLNINRFSGQKIEITYRLAVADYEIYTAGIVPNTPLIALPVLLIVVIVNSFIGVYAPIGRTPYFVAKLGNDFRRILVR